MNKKDITQLTKIVEEGDKLSFNNKMTASEMNIFYRERIGTLLFWVGIDNTEDDDYE